MMRGFSAVAALALLLAGCAGRDFNKEGATEDQFRNDEAACRGQVDTLTARDRNFDTDRGATLGNTDARLGTARLPTQLGQRSESNRGGKMMEACMRQRGWTPAKSAWWPF